MKAPPVTDLIRRRFSCRHYAGYPIAAEKQQALQTALTHLPPAPFGNQPRFCLITADENDNTALRGLGTYGFIRGATGFIIGASQTAPNHLEDFGYLMEWLILRATSLNLGTCWLGGTFTKSKFAQKIGLYSYETIPAVTAVGEFFTPQQARQGWISALAGSRHRLPWHLLFFERDFDHPLDEKQAGKYAIPLEMVRLAPSASNKQPWRVIKDRNHWHFYLQHTPGYRADPLKILLGLCDLQRLDMGIALCHFELTARESGLSGSWIIIPERQSPPGAQTRYTATWRIE
ncbi:MAG: nitroreductase [Anaerolineae bacterium]|nr:MAG: nitroreductase [Anaerolineae bacterium]